MQTGDTFGGSSPFLNNAVVTSQSEAANKSEFSVTSPAKQINDLPIDVNSSRNYYDIEKIDFNSALFLNCQEQTSSSESSYSTDNSIYYSDNHTDVEPSSVAAALSSNITKEKMQQKTLQSAKMAFRSKNSTENLSEDSGYGEFPSIKCRSKSIPNLNQDQLIEEDEHLDYNHRSLNNISQRKTTTPTPLTTTTSNRSNGKILSSKINSTHAENVRSHRVAPTNSVFGASKNSCRRERDWNDLNVPTNANGVSSKKSTSSTSLQPNTIQSTSLPDISSHFADDYGN